MFSCSVRSIIDESPSAASFAGKYPMMDASYQSATIPGLYFAGGTVFSLSLK